jgi:hypothetical protein
MFADPSQHPGTNLFTVVKREDKVRHSVFAQHAMGSGLTLDRPTNSQESGQDAPRPR